MLLERDGPVERLHPSPSQQLERMFGRRPEAWKESEMGILMSPSTISYRGMEIWTRPLLRSTGYSMYLVMAAAAGDSGSTFGAESSGSCAWAEIAITVRTVEQKEAFFISL